MTFLFFVSSPGLQKRQENFESFLFFVSSRALQKRQENFEACWSVKKLLKPTRASRTFTGRFYSINQDLHFVILNVISSK